MQEARARRPIYDVETGLRMALAKYPEAYEELVLSAISLRTLADIVRAVEDAKERA